MPAESRLPESKAIVFVVDDDLPVRQGLERLLRAVGWQVETFASAQGFLAHRKENLPSCPVLAFDDEYLLEIIRDAIRHHNGNGKPVGVFGKLIGQSGAWRRVMSQVEIVAPTDATVLILGETGTGKEQIATGSAEEILRAGRRGKKQNRECADRSSD